MAFLEYFLLALLQAIPIICSTLNTVFLCLFSFASGDPWQYYSYRAGLYLTNCVLYISLFILLTAATIWRLNVVRSIYKARLQEESALFDTGVNLISAVDYLLRLLQIGMVDLLMSSYCMSCIVWQNLIDDGTSSVILKISYEVACTLNEVILLVLILQKTVIRIGSARAKLETSKLLVKTERIEMLATVKLQRPTD